FLGNLRALGAGRKHLKNLLLPWCQCFAHSLYWVSVRFRSQPPRPRQGHKGPDGPTQTSGGSSLHSITSPPFPDACSLRKTLGDFLIVPDRWGQLLLMVTSQKRANHIKCPRVSILILSVCPVDEARLAENQT